MEHEMDEEEGFEDEDGEEFEGASSDEEAEMEALWEAQQAAL
jgi:hypothetical protein